VPGFPLVNKNGAWYFNTLAAKTRNLIPRIGKNENWLRFKPATTGGCKKYYARAPYGSARSTPQKLVSYGGKHNGLYWEEQGDQSIADQPF